MNTRTGATQASLPPLSEPCPKCGSETRSLVWIPAAGEAEATDATLVRLDPREHMQVTCSSCGFVWAAAPLDSSAPTPASEPGG